MSSISGISSGVTSTQSSGFGGINQSLNALQSALQSGNLSTAQTALTALLKNIQNLPQPTTASSNSSSPTNSSGSANSSNPVQSDLQGVQSALQSGNVGAAQTAFAKLKTDLQSSKGHQGHHHHHGGGGGVSSTSSSSTPTSTSSTSNSSSSTSGVTTNLLDAIQATSGSSESTSVNQLA